MKTQKRIPRTILMASKSCCMAVGLIASSSLICSCATSSPDSRQYSRRSVTSGIAPEDTSVPSDLNAYKGRYAKVGGASSPPNGTVMWCEYGSHSTSRLYQNNYLRILWVHPTTEQVYFDAFDPSGTKGQFKTIHGNKIRFTNGLRNLEYITNTGISSMYKQVSSKVPQEVHQAFIDRAARNQAIATGIGLAVVGAGSAPVIAAAKGMGNAIQEGARSSSYSSQGSSSSDSPTSPYEDCVCTYDGMDPKHKILGQGEVNYLVLRTPTGRSFSLRYSGRLGSGEEPYSFEGSKINVKFSSTGAPISLKNASNGRTASVTSWNPK